MHQPTKTIKPYPANVENMVIS